MLTMEVTEESNPDVRVSQSEADARLVLTATLNIVTVSIL